MINQKKNSFENITNVNSLMIRRRKNTTNGNKKGFEIIPEVFFRKRKPLVLLRLCIFT